MLLLGIPPSLVARSCYTRRLSETSTRLDRDIVCYEPIFTIPSSFGTRPFTVGSLEDTSHHHSDKPSMYVSKVGVPTSAYSISNHVLCLNKELLGLVDSRQSVCDKSKLSPGSVAGPRGKCHISQDDSGFECPQGCIFYHTSLRAM